MCKVNKNDTTTICHVCQMLTTKLRKYTRKYTLKVWNKTFRLSCWICSKLTINVSLYCSFWKHLTYKISFILDIVPQSSPLGTNFQQFNTLTYSVSPVMLSVHKMFKHTWSLAAFGETFLSVFLSVFLNWTFCEHNQTPI